MQQSQPKTFLEKFLGAWHPAAVYAAAPIETSKTDDTAKTALGVNANNASVSSQIPHSYDVVSKSAIVQAAMGQVAKTIHQKLSAEGKSCCFSPLSIFPVLSLIAEGMAPQKQNEFFQSLGFSRSGITMEDIRSALTAIAEDGSPDRAKNQFKLYYANALAVAQAVRPEFQAIAQQGYGAEVFTCSQDPVAACKTVNDWVSKKTCSKIPLLLTPDGIPLDLAAVLLNAIFFSGTWKHQFVEYMTTKEKFTFANGASMLVPTMKLGESERFRIYRDSLFDMLDMPFEAPGGQNLSCRIFLPKDSKKLRQIEAELDLSFIQKCSKAAEWHEVDVKFPKIHLDIKVGDLIPILKGLGGIESKLPLPGIGDRVALASIVHQAKLTIDENGAEGAATTAALFMRECCGPKPISFTVDHDFAFVIMLGDTILFQGSVKDLSAFPSN